MQVKSQPTSTTATPIMPMTSSQETSIITIGEGLTKEFLFGERIVIYHLDTVAREILDAGADDVLDTMKNWQTNQPFLVLYDITSTKIALTPHLRHRLQELSNAFPDLKGRAAVVLPQSIITQVFRLFVRSQNRIGRSKQVFFSRESAIDWLKEKLSDL